MSLQLVDKTASFGGTVERYKHASTATGTEMRFAVFRPPQAATEKVPVLYWLSGLTCTEENFTTKAGAYRDAAQLGMAILAPDTSPRGDGVADDPAYDLGQGASFYVDATQAPWSAHFRMESWLTSELLPLVAANFPVDLLRTGISGHSMGGHGALTLALRHPAQFRSVSAFAPISSPTRCPWGTRALGAYLGADSTTWREHDAALLIESGAARGHYDEILVDQGGADNFLVEQLKPELLEEACARAGQRLNLRRREGYDHSYFFVGSFIGEHLAWHAERLR